MLRNALSGGLRSYQSHLLRVGGTYYHSSLPRRGMSTLTTLQLGGTDSDTHKRPKARTSKANILRPVVKPIPTPLIVTLAEKQTERESQELPDQDVPLTSAVTSKIAVQTQLYSRLLSPVESHIPEHYSPYLKALAKAGYIRVLPDNSYVYLPLAERVLGKLQTLVQTAVVEQGYQLVNVPTLVPRSFLEATGRIDILNKQLLQATNPASTSSSEYYLAEPFDGMLQLAKRTLDSYDQLPLKLTQHAITHVVNPSTSLPETRSYQELLSFHPTNNAAHFWYKILLDEVKLIFEKLDVPVLQVQADPGPLGGTMSHEYHIPLPVKAEHTHSTDLLKCEMCGYTATQEQATFGINPSFDQIAYNTRIKKGPIPEAIRNDPRSVGLFPTPEETAREKTLSSELLQRQKQLDMNIRATLATVMKQVLPDLARKDVPMIANVVKLHYLATDSKSRDVKVEDHLFRNHALIMFRADRNLDIRHVCRYFECDDAEILPCTQSALLLLKYHKFKVQQHNELKKQGKLPPNHNNPFYRPTTHHHKLDLERMVNLEAANDRKGLEAEERRVERLNARINVDSGLLVMVDESLVADGMDLDSTGLENINVDALNEQNKDRSRGHGLIQSSPNQSLLDSIKSSGMKIDIDDEDDLQALQEKLENAGTSISDLEEELGISAQPHILNNTEYTPELGRIMGEESDNEMMNELTALTTANPIQGDFVHAQDGDTCIQQACHGQGVLVAKKGLPVVKLNFLSDRIPYFLDMKYGDDDGSVNYLELVRSRIDYDAIFRGVIEHHNPVLQSQTVATSAIPEHFVLPETIAPYMVCVTSVGDIEATPTWKEGEIPGYILDQTRVERERKTLRRSRRTLRAQGRVTQASIERERIEQNLSVDNEEREKCLGLWSWGDAPRKVHVENIASLLNSSVASISNDVVIDDRQSLFKTDEERLKSLMKSGIPYIIIVDEKFEKEGLLKLYHNNTNMAYYYTLDYIASMFSGLIPEDERPEFDLKAHNRKMQYLVEEAAMNKYGMSSSHKGDPDYFKIDTTSEIMYDYNELDRPMVDNSIDYDISKVQTLEGELDVHDPVSNNAAADEDGGANGMSFDPASPEFDNYNENITELNEQDKQKVLQELDEKEDKLQANQFESEVRSALQSNATYIRNKKRGLRVPREYFDMSMFEDKHITDENHVIKEKAARNAEKDEYGNEWLQILKEMRGPQYPPPNFAEIQLLFKAGIVCEPRPGVLRINEPLALANLHVVRSGMKLKLQYPKGLSDAQGHAINAKKELRLDIPGADAEVSDFSMKMLKKALQKPLNPPLTPLEVKRVKYEEFGIIDGDAEEFDLFTEKTETALPQQAQAQAQEQEQQTQQQAQVFTSTNTNTSTTSSTTTTTSTSTSTSTSKPVVKNVFAKKFSLSHIDTKYKSRLETARQQIAEEDAKLGIVSEEQITGYKDALKVRKLDGTVFHESKANSYIQKDDASQFLKKKPLDINNTKFPNAKSIGKGTLTGIMSRFTQDPNQ